MRDSYQLDEPNPSFFQVFEFDVSFPGTAPIVIEAYDYDMLFGDDLIGRTTIDLDDRFFSPEWRSIKNKPIEYRELYHESTQLAQGTITCWLDIIERKSKSNMQQDKKWDNSPEPTREYQLRVAVYEASGVKTADVIEGTSDVFVKAWLSGSPDEKRETDTHWRCTTGNPSFNYRLLFDFKAPQPKRGAEKEAYKLNIQLFDRDILKSNDFLAHFELDLKPLVDEVRSLQRPMNLSRKYYEKYFSKHL